MTTIKDVADRAGVSITTVSHVINETRYVSEELTNKVLLAMSDLEYQPNFIARGLRSGSTKTIGLIIPDISNLFFAEFSRRIEDCGFDHGYNVVLCNTDGDIDKEKVYIDFLLSKQIDGLIFFSAGDSKVGHRKLNKQKTPVVIVDREPTDVHADIVLINNRAGGYIATNYLLSLNHKRIGCIAGPSLIRPSSHRVEGYKSALLDHGVSIDNEIIRAGDFRISGGECAMHELLNLTDPPTAVFVCNDMMALGAMRAIYSKGKNIPSDFSIVGFDNTLLASIVNPALTTISQPIHEMADRAIELLIEKINHTEDIRTKPQIMREYQRVVLDTELIIRDSCKNLES